MGDNKKEAMNKYYRYIVTIAVIANRIASAKQTFLKRFPCIHQNDAHFIHSNFEEFATNTLVLLQTQRFIKIFLVKINHLRKYNFHGHFQKFPCFSYLNANSGTNKTHPETRKTIPHNGLVIEN